MVEVFADALDPLDPPRAFEVAAGPSAAIRQAVPAHLESNVDLREETRIITCFFFVFFCTTRWSTTVSSKVNLPLEVAACP